MSDFALDAWKIQETTALEVAYQVAATGSDAALMLPA